jgi:restriction system protein
LFGYLRKISPLVFEEAILSELADRGHRIERSASYSGDGGVDGVFEIDGRRWMIQAKRYGAHVSAAHVEMFARLCEAKDACGLFVHTGRTGRLAWSHERASGYVRIISGDDLVKLFAGEPIRLLRSRAEG